MITLGIKAGEEAHILARACFLSGFYVQEIAANGIAYIKIDKNPILSKQLEAPDFFVGIDAKGAKDTAIAIVDAAERPKKGKIKSYYLNATEISLNAVKRPAILPMLGALSKIMGRLSLKSIRAAMEIESEATREAFQALEEGYKSVKRV